MARLHSLSRCAKLGGMPGSWPVRGQTQAQPVVLFPAPLSQWRAPETVLGRLEEEGREPGGLHPRFAAPRAFNGPVYAMRRLHVEPRLRIDCTQRWYFDSLSTSELLELEGRYRRSPAPGRRMLDGAGRTAGIGISTVVAWPEGGIWKAFVAPLRARSMPHRAGLLHVVPSGMFAPPYSVVANVRRELKEELGLDLDPRRLRLTGVAMHTLNQRPEICTALFLPCRPAARLNDEFAPRLMETPLRPGLRPDALRGFFAPGAAALVLAARMLEQCAGAEP